MWLWPLLAGWQITSTATLRMCRWRSWSFWCSTRQTGCWIPLLPLIWKPSWHRFHWVARHSSFLPPWPEALKSCKRCRWEIPSFTMLPKSIPLLFPKKQNNGWNINRSWLKWMGQIRHCGEIEAAVCFCPWEGEGLLFGAPATRHLCRQDHDCVYDSLQVISLLLLSESSKLWGQRLNIVGSFFFL